MSMYAIFTDVPSALHAKKIVDTIRTELIEFINSQAIGNLVRTQQGWAKRELFLSCEEAKRRGL